MAKSFPETVEGWIFCGYDILLFKWRRARVLVRSDADRTVVDRMADQLKVEMAKEFGRRGMAPSMIDGLVLQTNGDRYAGPLLADRFQIMEDWVGIETGRCYYVVDHLRDDLLFREKGPASNTLRFNSIEDAESFLKEFTGSETLAISAGHGESSPRKERKVDMAKTATVTNPAALAAAKKAAAMADAKIGKKPIVAAVPEVPATRGRGRPPAVVPAPAPVAARGRGRPTGGAPAPAATVATTTRGEGVGAYTQELIKQGLDNASVITKLQARFPDKANSTANVSWYRNKLKKTGEYVSP